VSVLGRGCFPGCCQLQRISFQRYFRLKFISTNLFARSSLKQISLPKSVESIGEQTFTHCSFLREIFVEPDLHLTSIKSSALAHVSIHNIVLSPHIRDVSRIALAETISISSLGFRPVSEFAPNAAIVFLDGQIAELRVPVGLAVLGSDCFAGCKSFHCVIFEPLCRTSRCESRAFANSSIVEIVVPTVVEVIRSDCVSGYESLFSKPFDRSSRCSRIESRAFSKSGLVEVSIPQLVIHLGQGAFAHCRSVREIVFHSQSNLMRIEESAFANSIIAQFTMRNSSKSIAENTLSMCCC
jgi:hypothetical protein